MFVGVSLSLSLPLSLPHTPSTILHECLPFVPHKMFANNLIYVSNLKMFSGFCYCCYSYCCSSIKFQRFFSLCFSFIRNVCCCFTAFFEYSCCMWKYFRNENQKKMRRNYFVENCIHSSIMMWSLNFMSLVPRSWMHYVYNKKNTRWSA